VHLGVSPALEQLVTQSAGELSVARVHRVMVAQLIGRVEAARAVGADVWLGGVVARHVLPQLALRRELLGADVADEPRAFVVRLQPVSLRVNVNIFHYTTHMQLVAWHSGRTSVSGRRTFPVLRSTCS